MAVTSEQIAAALKLDYETNAVAVDEMRKRVNAHLAGLETELAKQSRMESLIKKQLGEWGAAMEEGDRVIPTDVTVWCSQVEACIAQAGVLYEEGQKEQADFENDLTGAYEAEQEQMLKEAADKDRESVIKLEEYTGEVSVTGDGYAEMGHVVADRLTADQTLRTANLATCAGVTLFDPVTRVGAVMHVYDKTQKPTIQDALEAMKRVDGRVDPRRLQVAIMPGSFEHGEMSHVASLRAQLSSQGIRDVRDFSREGRASSTLQLRGDGAVLSTGEAEKEKRTMGPSLPGPPSSRTHSESDSVGSVDSLASHLPMGISSTGMGAGMTSGNPTRTLPPEGMTSMDSRVREASEASMVAQDASRPPPPRPTVLPPMPDDGDNWDDLDSPKVEKSVKTSSTLPPPLPEADHLSNLSTQQGPPSLSHASSSGTDTPPPESPAISPRTLSVPPPHLPPRPHAPVPESPDVSEFPPMRARSASVREVLASGKNKQGGASQAQDQDGPSTGSKLKRSNSDSQLGGGRRL